MASPPTYPQLDTLVDSSLFDKAHREKAIVPTFQHRLNLCRSWNIPKSSRLLDIGCGQGESSLVLADEVGPNGHVTGVDPAPADYGAPYTLGQSQDHILASPFGSRITFKRSDPTDVVLSSQGQGAEPAFDGAVFCQSLWYFHSPEVIRTLFSALAKANIPRIYFAEWKGETGSASDIPGAATPVAQEPHALAARAQMILHANKENDGKPRVDDPNIRGALLPDELFRLAEAAGNWKVAARGEIAPPSTMLEGHWECQFVKSDEFRSRVHNESGLSASLIEELDMYIEMVKQTSETVKNSRFGKVACMNVVWAVLEQKA